MMESGDNLEKECSDEEDSFDVPIVTKTEMDSKETEDNEDEEEENKEMRELDLEDDDFNVQTIERVPLDVLTARIGRVMCEVVYRGEPAAIALFDVATKIVFQSTMLDFKKNPVIDLITRGIRNVIIDDRERECNADQSEHVMMLFVAKLAIKIKSMKCQDLLLPLTRLIGSLYLHSDSVVRVRVCRLLALLVDESNHYADVMREHGDTAFLFTDEEVPEPEEMIPNGMKARWMGELVKSTLDKSPQVRSAAIAALSLWEPDSVCKTVKNGDITVNEVIWKSVHDVEASVRLSAIRRIHIVDEADIDKCIAFVGMSKDTRVRQAIIVRLASDVHLFSFSEHQRLRLVNMLSGSDSARIQDVIHQRLVESWMKVAAEEIVSPTIFPAPLTEHEIPNQFPSIILEYLDPIKDPTAVYVFMKFAIVRFIQPSSGQKLASLDIEQCMKNLLKMSIPDSESVGLMRRTTFRLVDEGADLEDGLKKTYIRIFITRCFVDVIFTFSKNRLDACQLRSRALTFFLPDVTSFVEYLDAFCNIYFNDEREDTQNSCTELVLLNIFHLLNVSVKYGDDDKILYREALKKLLENSRMTFSTNTIHTMVTISLDLCKGKTETVELCDWICKVANEMMLCGGSETLKEAMEKGEVSVDVYMRTATMLLAMCQHEDIEEPLPSMSNLFRDIIPALLGSNNEQVQSLGLQLIGFASTIDFDNCEPYLKLTRFLLQRDDQNLKATGLHTLTRVIKAHGFPKTSQSIFKEEHTNTDECNEDLAKLLEKTLIALEKEHLAQGIQDCLSMISYGQYAWSKMFSALLLICFNQKNEPLQLAKLFRSFCKSSIKSDFNRMNLLLGLTRAISVITKTSEQDASWNIVEMTETVCENLSKIQIIGDEEEDTSRNTSQEIYLEVELANRMINRAVSHKSAWFIRHVFTALSTSLRLECVPLKKLDELHNNFIDAYTAIRFSCSKTTQIALKRFLTHCEKVISLHERMNGLKMGVDLKTVKNEGEIVENELQSVSTTSSSSGRKRRCNKKSRSRESDSDDSFEYFPRSTRTRVRHSSSTSDHSPAKKIKIEEEEDANIDDSFEL